MKEAVRRIGKKGISILKGRTIRQLKREMIEKAEIVSFDMFDTLIVRNCIEPLEVFDIVEYRYNRENDKNKIEGFRRYRLEAEKEARKNNPEKEVTLEEIYSVLYSRYGERTEKIKLLEIDTEYNLCCENSEMKEFYDRIIGSGRRVIIISDMYLSMDILDNILQRCGYRGYESIFVSSEKGVTKRSGGLFKEAINKCNIKPGKLLHIGDHPVSDHYMPKRMGIQTFLYKKWGKESIFLKNNKRNKHLWDKQERIEFDVIKCAMLNDADHNKNVFRKVGYEVLGPMLMGYTVWLHAMAEKEKADSILFLAREGHILYRAYKELFPNQSQTALQYIHVSRLALCRANIINTHGYTELIFLFSDLMRGVDTVGEFAELLGISEFVPDICEGCRFTARDLLEEIYDKDRLYEKIIMVGNQYFIEQHKLLLEYLNLHQIGSGKIIVSDVGWNGTMQMLLSRLVTGVQWIGAYLGVSSVFNEQEYTSLDRRGYWFDASEWETKGQMVRFTTSAIETLFINHEGTTLEYRSADKEVKAVQSVCRASEEEIRNDKEVKDAAIECIRSFVERGIFNIIMPLDADIACFPYVNFAVYPKKATILFFKRRQFINGVKNVGFLPKHSLAYYLFHYKELKRDINLSTAKIIWFQGLLKIHLPYFELFCMLANKFGIKAEFGRKYLCGRRTNVTVFQEEKINGQDSGFWTIK